MKTESTSLNRQYLVIQKKNAFKTKYIQRIPNRLLKGLHLLFLLPLLAAFSSCCKEGPPGEDGRDGKDGNPGQSNKSIFISFSKFQLRNATKTYYYKLPSSEMPVQNQSTMVVGFVQDNTTSTNDYTHWIPMPYSDFYNNGTVFNEYSYSVDIDGRTWVFIRNSNGALPFSNMTSTVYGMAYKFFMLKKANLPPDLDINNYNSVKAYVSSIEKEEHLTE